MPTPLREEEGNTAAAIDASGCSVLRSRQNLRTLRNNMHENREISWTSWLVQQDRSAKAIDQNADVNVQEKSDCAVVPLNRPNKEGQPSAEVGEGRARTEENIVQSHMSPTQSGKSMSQGLGGVRQAASVGKQERFTALLHHLSLNLLRDSFYALKRQASPGVDGVTWQEYEKPGWRVASTIFIAGCTVERTGHDHRDESNIPKADGRQRPLGIAALEDKIVQQAVVPSGYKSLSTSCVIRASPQLPRRSAASQPRYDGSELFARFKDLQPTW
jgi:RNA-directed DNA polymerase